MAQPIEKRINGNKKEIVELIQNGQWGYVCREMLHCGSDSLQHWYNKQPHHEDDSIYSYNSKVNVSTPEEWADYIVAALVRKLVAQDKELTMYRQMRDAEKLDKARRDNELKRSGLQLLNLIEIK